MISFINAKTLRTCLLPFNEHGNAAVELVLVAPILLALIFTLVDMGRIIITDSILQSVVGEFSGEYRVLNDESRNALSNVVVGNDLSKIVETSGRGWIDIEKLSFQVNSGGSESYVGNSGQMVTYELTYTMTSSAPFIHYVLDKTFFLRKVHITIRNQNTGEL